MLPAVLASLAYRCSQVECSGWLSTIDARFNANFRFPDVQRAKIRLMIMLLR